MDPTKKASSDQEQWVSPHVAKREAKKAKAAARKKEEQDPGFMKGIWDGFKALFNRQERPHIHVPTPKKVRDRNASLIKAVRPGKHRRPVGPFPLY